MPKAREMMTRNPATCQETDTAYDAVKIMKRENCGVVPIVDQQGQCAGIVTDRDLCLQVIGEKRDPQATRLADMMSREVLTAKVEEEMEPILDRMKERQVNRIVVVDEQNRCVGIISEHDLAQRLQNPSQLGELATNVYS
jgi:CBS domain-containing protein